MEGTPDGDGAATDAESAGLGPSSSTDAERPGGAQEAAAEEQLEEPPVDLRGLAPGRRYNWTSGKYRISGYGALKVRDRLRRQPRHDTHAASAGVDRAGD